MSSFSIKRLNKELESFIKDPSPEYTAGPIKDDLYCWHFTIRGPSDTPFENGIYHGVIKLPFSYPNKPPNIMFLTPSGRFEVNSNICLSITKYHTEEWQSAWTIRSMLEAIIAFMPIHEDHDAIGAMDTSEEARKKYAIMSRNFVCDVCGPIVDLLPKVEEKEDKKEENNENLNEDKNDKNDNDNNNNTDDIKIKEIKNKENVKVEVEDDLKFKTSKSEKINYTEIFKKIRQSQYSKINEEIKKKESNEINNNNNNEEEEEEENEEDFNERNYKINNSNNLLDKNMNSKKKKEKLNPLLEEELEFFEIQKSIKFHENEDKNEIEENFINNKKNKNINKEYLKNLTNEKKIELLKLNKQHIEKFFNKQINFLKYYSKKTYEETRSKTLKNFNIIMTCIIIFIFILYWIIIKLNIKFSKYGKIKSYN